MGSNKTANQLLDAAEVLVQQRGFNAFSYKDLAHGVGIRPASVHYHFPAKPDLAAALMARYSRNLRRTLAEFDASMSSPRARLSDFVGLYRTAQQNGAICVCGSLAADLTTLPQSVRDEVAGYIEASEAWIVQSIEAGIAAGEFEPEVTPQDAAACLLAGLQGALILSRARGLDPELLDSVEASFMRSLTRDPAPTQDHG